MPFRSAKQRRAMYAALRGKSKLGISKRVAARFIRHARRGRRR